MNRINKDAITDGLSLGKLTGLGLNRQELEENVRLTEWVVHDKQNLTFLVNT